MAVDVEMFIKENEKLLRDFNHFDELYNNWYADNYILTEFFQKVGIEVQNYLTTIPKNFIKEYPSGNFDEPNNVIQIASSGFSWVKDLEEVHIGRRVTKIHSNAFYQCRNLKEIIFKYPGSLQAIGSAAFYGCSSLVEVTLPETLTYIGSYTFFNCTNLKEINIPDGVKNIFNNTFYRCPNLEKVYLGEGIESIEHEAFCNCEKIKNISLPDGLKVIGERAFAGCSGLSKLIIPYSIEIIESKAFSNCKEIEFEYSGTKAEWRKIAKTSAFPDTDYICHCTDGDVLKKGN